MSQDILFTRLPGKKADIGEIQLNRPKTLNALTLSMCQALHEQLEIWQADDTIKAVIIRGVGERAFCAGGDVRSLYENRDNPSASINFFRQEYRMNKAIYHFTKPYISLLDGLTMGGGAGISIHGSHRIGTEYFSFAMPETAIGFFPDIGSACFLNRCPGKIGYYLGLTGTTIKGNDALAVNIINYAVARQDLPKLINALCEADFSQNGFDVVTDCILSYEVPSSESDLLQNQSDIDHCFKRNSVEEIINALKKISATWAKEAVDILLRRSPLSLKVTLEHLQRAQSQSDFDQLMQQDFNVAQQFVQSHDFYEGVRAVLIDKDQTPQWQPAQLNEITEKGIDKFFEQKEIL